jgi:N utilization substance protein B
MGKRREGREAAMQFLFQRDHNSTELPELLQTFSALRPLKPPVQQFCTQLVNGVAEHQSKIDERIQKYTTNYELRRIAAVDRNVLRLAVYEMLYTHDVPPIVIINEAIEIAKRFGSDESGRFVNGILDRIRTELDRPARTPGAPQASSNSDT